MECAVYQTRPIAEPRVAPAWLSVGELDRWRALRRAADQARFATGAGLLRMLVGQVLGIAPAQVRVDRYCPNCDRAHGKPTIPDSDLQVSVSHAQDVVLVALAQGATPIGVDVERVGHAPTVDEIASYALAPEELGRILGANGSVDRAAFFEAWTRKEAILKATGDGLRIPMASLTLTVDGELRTYPGRPGLAARIVGLDAGAEYTAALAALTDELLVVRHLIADIVLE